MKLTNIALAAVTGLAAATSLNSLKFQFQNPLAAADAGTLDEPVPGESPIQICDEESETRLLDIKYVNLTPNPPARGVNLTIEAEGEFKKQIEEGAYIDVDVRYGYIRLLKQTFDLCEQIENVDKKCPLDKGVHKIVKDVQLPNEIPPGKYVVNARAYTVDDEFITCLSATVEFPYEL